MAFTWDRPPPHPHNRGTFVTTCFYLQLAYFQQPIPNMLGPLFKSLLSNMHILYRKEKDKKGKGILKWPGQKTKRIEGAVFQNKENSENLLKGPCLPLPIKQSRTDRERHMQPPRGVTGRGPRQGPRSAPPHPASPLSPACRTERGLRLFKAGTQGREGGRREKPTREATS